MDISLNRDSRVPLYQQVVDHICDLIKSGGLPEGFTLPPERKLADALGVNRSTILTAYRELKGRGLVDAHVGRGTVVHAPQVEPVNAERSDSRELPWRQLFRNRRARTYDPMVRDLLELTERSDSISLSIGLPAPELIPVDTLRQISDELMSSVGAPLMLHSPTEGLTGLRETLAQRLSMRGIRCAVSNLMVVSGSQQGLDLVARTLIDPGDVVIVEEPTYLGALPAFRAAEARLVGVPVDHNGMRTDMLEDLLLRLRPKLIYTLPTYQNPSGAVLSLERRQHLLELANRYGVAILEDDPYSELRYRGPVLPSLKALDSTGSVIYLSTFSKTMFPGLRVGFVVAPSEVTRQLALEKQSIDLHSNTFGQWLIDRFISEGHYDQHLENQRHAYNERRKTMIDAMADAVDLGVTWNDVDGGYYLWCQLPANIERSLLFGRAAEHGVTYLPGSACFIDEAPQSYARLNFSFPRPELIRKGIDRFLDAIRESRRDPLRPESMNQSTPPLV